ncbi:hypothetical protein T439DRAFT_26445 [Meredithblackwellia eburnea MCA 4105]
MSEDEDTGGAFIPVNHKKTRAPKKRKGKQKPKERTVAEKVASRRQDLVNSNYLERCKALIRGALNPDIEKTLEAMPSPTCTVCLGLGTVSGSSKSQNQFVLLQSILDELAGSPKIFDPVSSEEDNQFLAECNFEVLRSEHDFNFKETTLLFMPHCPRSLFEELLRKNWNPSHLSRLIILGNRLEQYEDPTHPSASSSSKSPFISKSIPLWNVIPLPQDPNFVEPFNDMALQWISLSKLQGIPDFASKNEAEDEVDILNRNMGSIEIYDQ